MFTTFLGKQYPIKFWNGEKMGYVVAVDTETTIAPFTKTPDCVTVQMFDGDVVYYLTKEQYVQNFLHSDAKNLVLHNAVFDMDVIDADVNAWHSKLDKELIWDTMLLYRLWHLATQGFVPFKASLDHVCQELLSVTLNKDDEIRMGFGQFLNQPLSSIPQKFLVYGAEDVIATYFIHQELKAKISALKTDTNLTHGTQLKGAYALNKIYKNGINIDQEKANAIYHDISTKMDHNQDILATYGWVRGQKGCNEKYEELVRDLFKLDLPLTESGSISSKSEDLQEFKDNPFIKSYLEFNDLEKQLSFVKDIRHESRVHPRYNPILNTGRTSCSKPNFQQLPRSGDIRSVFVAEPGSTFIITDYSAIELATLAQTCYERFGHSTMRQNINDGVDLHRYYASVLHGIEPEEVTKQQRQEAKAANFGFPGGLGIETFIAFSKGYGLELSEKQAQDMKNAWFEAFPEMKEYMNFKEDNDEARTLSGRIRARASYCARKNTPFQGLAADGAKIALYNLVKEGFKLRGFVHDEIISECRLEHVDKYIGLQEKIMIDSMSIVCPDVKITVESTVSDRYCK